MGHFRSSHAEGAGGVHLFKGGGGKAGGGDNTF